MRQMKTLFISDLDGTLVLPNGHISEYTVNTINRFIEGGGCFTYATGRSYTGASAATGGIRLDFPVICNNGAFIFGKSKEVLREIYLGRPEIEDIRRKMRLLGVSPIVYSHANGAERFSFIEDSGNAGLQSFLDRRRGDPRCRPASSEEDLYSGDVVLILYVCEKAERTGALYDMVKTDCPVQAFYYKDFYTDSWWCEILPQNATKGAAAAQLKEALGFDRLVVFGDETNDMSLFNLADESYAMANAVPELKKIATSVIGSNEEDGVAKWFEANMMGSSRL